MDQASNLYVADTGANRVLIFPNTQNAPPAGVAASFVIGQASFGRHRRQRICKSPAGVAVDSSGNIYVADSGNNRVLIYPSLVFLPSCRRDADRRGRASRTTSGDGRQLGFARRPGDGRRSVSARSGCIWTGRTRCTWAMPETIAWCSFLKPAAVVNAATFQASVPVAPGGLATLFGNGLASDKTYGLGDHLADHRGPTGNW